MRDKNQPPRRKERKESFVKERIQDASYNKRKTSCILGMIFPQGNKASATDYTNFTEPI
jgi:hypothetical protein